ncbi:MAG: hypothetical protein Q7S02_01245 [bacterium]|nr:hypothetical protein [bacterium]
MAMLDLVLPRRVVADLDGLLSQYPTGILAMIGTASPEKLLRTLTRIQVKLWDEKKAYVDKSRTHDEMVGEASEPFDKRIAQAEELHKDAKERASVLEGLEEEKSRHLWITGTYLSYCDLNTKYGAEPVTIPFPKDLFELTAECVKRYVTSKLDSDDMEPEKVKDGETPKEPKKKPANMRFVVQRKTSPFGGSSEVPIVLNAISVAELEYALGLYDEAEQEDMQKRVEQLWQAEREAFARQVEKFEKKYGPVKTPTAPALV